MSLDLLTQFFAWFTLINYAVLLFAWLAYIFIKDFAMQVHGSSMGVPRDELPRLYFQFFSFYKTLILTFGLVPYLVLRFFL